MDARYHLKSLLAKPFYYLARKRLPQTPRIVAIETTNYCNLSCPICPRRHMTRSVGCMEFALFKRIIGQIHGSNAGIWLHNFGEPLCHPQLAIFIDYCSRKGLRPMLSTNATMLDYDKAVMLLKSGLRRIILCLDATTEEAYRKIRVGGNYDAARANIANFLRLKKEMRNNTLRADVQIIRIKENNAQIDTFKKEWSGLADSVLVRDFVCWGYQVHEINDMAQDENIIKRRKRFLCQSVWKVVAVLWNGDVVPCCNDFDGKIVIGNLNEKSLEAIWASDKIWKLRVDFVRGNYDNALCRNCTVAGQRGG